MRAAPAFQVSLQRFGVWQGAMLSLAGLDVAVMMAWLFTRETPMTWADALCAAVAAISLTALGVALAKTPATELRWDGRAWHLGPAAGESAPGELGVAIDLGAWMLLRFAAHAADARPRTVWLPAQRRGLESQWHALRCAVYSPRPAPTEDAPMER